MECLLLGLNFLMPHVSEIFLSKYQIRLKANKALHVVPLNNENKKLVFKAKESFQAGAGIITCYPCSFVCAATVYDVPTEFQQLLGMSQIVLSPGSIRKQVR